LNNLRNLDSFGLGEQKVENNRKTKIFTVRELTKYISKLFENDERLTDVIVEGEISNFNHHSSGHLYFSIKDESSVLRCIMFRRDSERLRFTPEDGMTVLARGNVRVYEKGGVYQLYVRKLEMGGEGNLYLAFKKLKEKLKKEGLFDETHKKPIPRIPERIGIVTSPTGAAIRDILNVIGRRYPVDIILAPVRVQGLEASREIEEGIRRLNEIGGIDVIIVGRGGGSIEDLWAFNEERVARAIFNSEIPIISAVGHETDFTIADFVADARAPTPSAAAELAVPDKEEIAKSIDSFKIRIAKAMNKTISLYRERLKAITRARIFREPIMIVDQKRQQLDDLFKNLYVNVKHFIELEKGNFHAVSEKFNALSPMAILERGYSIVIKMPEGFIVKKIRDVELGDSVKMIVKDGEAICSINKKKEGEFGRD